PGRRQRGPLSLRDERPRALSRPAATPARARQRARPPGARHPTLSGAGPDLPAAGLRPDDGLGGRPMRLKGQVALVTGAGRGIVEAIALAFAREGAKVAVADVDPNTARATARRLGRGRALALHMDVADAASVRDGFEAIDRAWGRIDIAVTNAAVEPIVPFLELTAATWDRVVDVNLKGTFLVARRRLRADAAAARGRAPRDRGGRGLPRLRRGVVHDRQHRVRGRGPSRAQRPHAAPPGAVMSDARLTRATHGARRPRGPRYK